MGTDRTALTVLGAAAVLLVALVASTAGGLGPVHLHSSSAQQHVSSPAQPSRSGTTQGGGQLTGSPVGHPDTGPWLPTWSQAVLIAVLAAFVLTILATVRITLVRPRKIKPGRSRSATALQEPEADEAPETLRSMLDEQLSALNEGTPRNAIVAAWVQLEDFAISHGLPKDPTDTPAEFVARALAAYDLDSAAIQRLADLYREARFSKHPLGEAHRAEARACLQHLTGAAVYR